MPIRYYPFITILCLTAFIGVINFKYLKPHLKTLVLLVIFNLAGDTLGRWMSVSVGSNNPVFHFQLPGHVVFYWIIYHQVFRLNVRWHLLFLMSLIFTLYNSLFIQSIWIFPSFGILPLAIIIVVISLRGFLLLTRSKNLTPLAVRSEFWFLFGNLMFFSTTFFSFGMINFIHSKFPAWLIWTIYTCNLLLYSCYLISILVGSSLLKYGK